MTEIRKLHAVLNPSIEGTMLVMHNVLIFRSSKILLPIIYLLVAKRLVCIVEFYLILQLQNEKVFCFDLTSMHLVKFLHQNPFRQFQNTG